MIKAASNFSALAYWQQTGYSRAAIDEVCCRIDGQYMAARVDFHGAGKVALTISNITYDRGEGHVKTVASFVEQVAATPILLERKGSLIIWLEDGLWRLHRHRSIAAPIFAFGRDITDPTTLLMPDPAFLTSRGYEGEIKDLETRLDELDWNSRRPTVFWRGATTGLGIEGRDWMQTHRGRLTTFCTELNDPETLDAKFTKGDNLPPEQRQLFEDRGLFAAYTPFEDFLNYRYLVDADGYACAWRSLFLKLASGSVVLKMESSQEQWYFRELVPWKHYIPLDSELSTFSHVVSWLRNHDDAARAISINAREFVRKLTYERAVEETAEVFAQMLDCAR